MFIHVINVHALIKVIHQIMHRTMCLLPKAYLLPIDMAFSNVSGIIIKHIPFLILNYVYGVLLSLVYNLYLKQWHAREMWPASCGA